MTSQDIPNVRKGDMQKKIAVLSHIVIDEVHPFGAARPSVAVGGAGAYAATGASLAVLPASAHVSAVLVSGVGRNDRALLTEWCGERQIDPGGLFDVGADSPRTRIDYFADGERVETPAHGLEHFDAHTPLPRHIPVDAGGLAGVYLFHDHDAAYWREIEAFRLGTGTVPILWEISLDSCRPEARAAVFERLESVDILSINRTEALALFGATTIAEVLDELRRAPVSVVLRCGAEGSVVLDAGETISVSIAEGRVVDPTGGGNSYSGAFLAEFARSGDPLLAARVATAVASVVIGAPGAPLVDDGTRERVRSIARVVEAERH